MQSGTHPGTDRSNAAAAPAPIAGSIESEFTGDNAGQIAVGNNIVQWTVHGDFIEASEETARPRPRPTPVSVLPKRMHTFLDRETERAAAARAMESAMTVELCGESGQGKTALLRYLAHNSTGDFCREGIIYFDDRDESLDDVLQYLYDTFHEYEIPYKPNEAELRLALGEKCALILVDEVELSSEDVERLTNSVPKSTLVFAGDAPRVAGEVETVPLAGLPFAEALLLMQSALGRMVEADELETARALWESTEGNPGQILKAAKLARAEGAALIAPGTRAQGGDAPGAVAPRTVAPGGGTPGVDVPPTNAPAGPTPTSSASSLDVRGEILARAIGSLNETQRRVLDAMRPFGRTPVAAAHIAAISEVSAAPSVLADLADRELVELVDEREETYRLDGDVAAMALTPAYASPMRDRAVAYFASLIETSGGSRGTAGRALVRPRDVGAALAAAGWGLSSARLAESLPIAAWVDGALTLSGRWDARGRLLENVLQAARRSSNKSAEAWALHQSGSRMLELGQRDEAVRTLREALRIREEIGDIDGADVTRHNLGLIVPPPTPVDERSMRKAFIIIGVAIVALIALIFLLRGSGTIAAPASLSAERTLVGGPMVQLNWEDRSDNEEGFAIERAVLGSGFRSIATTTSAQTSFVDPDADPALAHVYRVRAFAGEEWSDYSNADTIPGAEVVVPDDVPISRPRIVFDTSAIDFGVVAVDSLAARRLTITNDGDTSATIMLTGPELPFSIAGGETSMVLAAGAGRAITLRYAPTAEGMQRGALTIDSPDDTLGPQSIRLFGSGMGPRTAVVLASARFEKPELASGSRVRLEVRFDGVVEQDEVVRLSTGDRDVVVPASVTVPRGRDRASVTVGIPTVTKQRTIRVDARHGTTSITATGLVVPPAVTVTVAEVLIAQRSVVGGTSTKGSIRLSGPAPAGGAVVALRSSSTSVRVPTSVSVAAGSSSASFAISTRAVRSQQEASITASLAGAQVSAPLTVTPRVEPPQPPLFRLSLKPESSVLEVGRSGGKSSATVGISRGTRGGVFVGLQSSDPNLVIVPSSVTIAPGATAAEFSFTVRRPQQSTTVTITATVSNPMTATTSATITVKPVVVID